MERFESNEISETHSENFDTPEIVVQREKGMELLSQLLHIKEIKDDQVEKEVLDFLAEIEKNEVDEETLSLLALTYKHEERSEFAFETIKRHKAHVSSPQELQKKLFEIFNKLNELHLEQNVQRATEADHSMQVENLRLKFKKLISFFRPKTETTVVRRVLIIPTKSSDKKDSGASYHFGKELVMQSHVESPENAEHEFLHCIINPIVDKLSLILSESQQDRVSAIASEKLKQDYGEGYYSLLCEELIRTYNDYFKHGEKLMSFEEFDEKLSQITEQKFLEMIKQSQGFRRKCEALGIESIEELRSRSVEYFERFEKDELREMIFSCYQEYSEQRELDAITFEDYILVKLPQLLSK